MRKFWLRLRATLTLAPMVILIEDGRARKIRGNIPRGLLSEFTEAAGANGIDQGLVTVTKDGRSPVLHFFGPFDDSAEQRFRNIWSAQP